MTSSYQKNTNTSSPKEHISWSQRHPELVGIGMLAFSIALFLSLATFDESLSQSNLLGLVGHASAFFLFKLFGIASYILSTLVFALGLLLLTTKTTSRKKILFASLALFSLCMLFTLLADSFPQFETFFFASFSHSFHLGGTPSFFFYKEIPYVNFETLLNTTGTFILFFSSFCICLAYLFETSLRNLITSCLDTIKAKKAEAQREQEERVTEKETAPPTKEEPKKPSFYGLKVPSLLSHEVEMPPSFDDIPDSLLPRSRERPEKQLPEREIKTHEITSRIPQKKQLPILPLSTTFTSGGVTHYTLPSADILNIPKKSDTSQLKKELKQKADLLEETLMSFGIEAKVGQIHSGPTITSFEVHPAVGVKVGRIKTLEQDIALNMEAKSIRIIAPIPGKAAVGIEVPNKQPQEVSFKELLSSWREMGSPYKIPMLLGKTVNGEPVLADLAKMPHCIIAGATGSGKSVCINSIVMSILMTATPDEIRLLMVDPKKVELTPYTNLPHMLAPVITDPKTACMALNWLVKEMEKRYEFLKITGQRNIESFNNRTKNEELEKAAPVEIPQKLPYYVAIIDELADLMMVASSDIETPIARIAQMARAVGIHLILATQRPSREVITGLIKANFPARISFKVASRVNSQIVLDEIGAETLLGNGDMLFLPPGSSHLVRAQGVFVRDEEINRTIEFITKQAPPQYIISSFDRLPELASDFSQDAEPQDSLFEDAKNVVLSTGNASTTFLQRKLKVGYARAASLMDELEKKGIVGPQEGAKPRKIFFQKSSGAPVGAHLDPDEPEDFEL
jgi:DNA segregation ATPase FtsK/SpoIIIE, S-DNA-T family